MSTSLPLPTSPNGLVVTPQAGADLLSGSPLSVDLTGEFGAHLKAELNSAVNGQTTTAAPVPNQALLAAIPQAAEGLPLDGKGLPLTAFLSTDGGLNVQLAGGEHTFSLSLPESGDFSFSYTDGEGLEGFGIQLSAGTDENEQAALSLALADRDRLLAVNFASATTNPDADNVSADLPGSEGLVPAEALLKVPSEGDVAGQGTAEQLITSTQALPDTEQVALQAQTGIEQAALQSASVQGQAVLPDTADEQAAAVRQAVVNAQPEPVITTNPASQATTTTPVVGNTQPEAVIPTQTGADVDTVPAVPVSKQAELARQHADAAKGQPVAPVQLNQTATANAPVEPARPSATAEPVVPQSAVSARPEAVVNKTQSDPVALNSQQVAPGKGLLNEQVVRAGQPVADAEPVASRSAQSSTSEQPVERDSLILKNNEFRRLQNLFEPVRQQIDATTNTAQVSRVADQLGETVQRVVAPTPLAPASPLLAATPVTETSLSSSTSGLTQMSVDVPLQNDKWQQAFSQRVVWSIGNAQSAQLKIHPAELGMIDIKLNMVDDKANVVFNTQHGAVKDAIESALPRLREMLAEQGLNLGDVDVREEGKPGQQAANDQDGQQQGLNDGAKTDTGENAEAAEGHELVTAFQVDDDSVDYYV